jgi:hypothetical protein
MYTLLKIITTISLCAALMMASTAEAALVNYHFSGTIDSGSLIGETYSGSFAYDNLTLTHSGAESIGLSALAFNILSSVYSLSNADFTPTADFIDGSLLGVSYLVSGIDPSFALVSASGSVLPEDVAYFSYQTVSGDSGFGSLTITSVPVPATVWLFGSGLGLLALIRRKNQTS